MSNADQDWDDALPYDGESAVNSPPYQTPALIQLPRIPQASSKPIKPNPHHFQTFLSFRGTIPIARQAIHPETPSCSFSEVICSPRVWITRRSPQSSVRRRGYGYIEPGLGTRSWTRVQVRRLATQRAVGFISDRRRRSPRRTWQRGLSRESAGRRSRGPTVQHTDVWSITGPKTEGKLYTKT